MAKRDYDIGGYKMKQLFIISKGSRTSQYGIGTYIKQLIGTLDISEWKVFTVELEAPIQECYSYVENGVCHFKIPDVEVASKWNTCMEKNYHRSVFYWLMSQLELNMHEPIYCHFNLPDSYELAVLFKQHLNAKILYTLHCMEWKFYLPDNVEKLQDLLQSPQTDKERDIANSFIRSRNFMNECCDRIVTVSRHSHEQLQTLYGLQENRLFYMPHALKDEYVKRDKQEIRKKYHIEDHERIILFVGRLNADKGIYNLIRAFNSLTTCYPFLHLIVAGSGDLNSLLNMCVPLRNKITFTGYADTIMLNELYSMADVGIIPSYHEELGYVAIEMMMHGLPVICSNASGLLEVTDYGKYGMVMDWNETNRDESIRKALEYWLENPSVFESFSRKGRERYLAEYSSEKHKRKIELLYQL